MVKVLWFMVKEIKSIINVSQSLSCLSCCFCLRGFNDWSSHRMTWLMIEYVQAALTNIFISFVYERSHKPTESYNLAHFSSGYWFGFMACNFLIVLVQSLHSHQPCFGAFIAFIGEWQVKRQIATGRQHKGYPLKSLNLHNQLFF